MQNVVYLNQTAFLLNNAKRIIEEIIEYTEGLEAGGLFPYEKDFIERQLSLFCSHYEGFLRSRRSPS